MTTRITQAILSGLIAVGTFSPAYAAEERMLATWKGGTGEWISGNWDIDGYPNLSTIDVLVDGNDDVNSAVTFKVGANTSYTNGALTIDAGDSVTYHVNDSTASSSHNWWMTCLTNRGTFVISERVGKNDQTATVRAEGAPFYNGTGAVIKVLKRAGYRGRHYLRIPLADSVNEGRIEVCGDSSRSNDCQLNFTGSGGILTNNGEILVQVEGSSTDSNVSSASINCAGPLTLLGHGSVWLDNDKRSPSGKAVAQLIGPGIKNPLVVGEGQTIKGDGAIMTFYLHNYGIIRSEGTNSVFKIQMLGWRDMRCAVTNEAGGCIIANSPKGISFVTRIDGGVGERPGWNARFINLGLLEARTGSQIAFSDGVNSTATKTGDSDLGATADYLKFWGRVAGGGQFKTIRPIHIMEDAVLAPGDLANDNGTGASTCGMLTFSTNLVMEAGAVAEFQCRKPVAGRFDSVWVNGNLTVAGKLKFTAKPGGGTYRLFTATGALTCDLQALTIECAEGVSEPKLKLVDSTYEVEEEVVDEGSGDVSTRKVSYPCKGLEATWVDGFLITIM